MSQPKLPSRKALPPFEALRAFDAVARLGGVRKAAQALCRDHAVVGRHLRAIEEWTGATLIQRTPAGVVLTEDGRHYHAQIQKAIDAIAAATIDLMKRNEDHCLQTWCMPAFALHWLIGHLRSFEEANPGLDVELRPTDEEPDFSRQEADVDIRLMPTFQGAMQFPPNVRALEMARPAIIPVASPAYLARSKAIEHPRDLLHHRLIHEDDVDNWRVWFAENGVDDDVELSGPRLWQGHLTLDAARRGRGIALTNHFVAAEDLAAGRLIDVSAGKPEFKPVKLWAYMFVARADRWDYAPIERFRHWLLSTIARESARLDKERVAAAS